MKIWSVTFTRNSTGWTCDLTFDYMTRNKCPDTQTVSSNVCRYWWWSWFVAWWESRRFMSVYGGSARGKRDREWMA